MQIYQLNQTGESRSLEEVWSDAARVASAAARRGRKQGQTGGQWRKAARQAYIRAGGDLNTTRGKRHRVNTPMDLWRGAQTRNVVGLTRGQYKNRLPLNPKMRDSVTHLGEKWSDAARIASALVRKKGAKKHVLHLFSKGLKFKSEHNFTKNRTPEQQADLDRRFGYLRKIKFAV